MSTYTNTISAQQAAQALSQAGNDLTINEISQMYTSQTLLNKQVSVSENMQSYENKYLNNMKKYMTCYIVASVASAGAQLALSYYAFGSNYVSLSNTPKMALDVASSGTLFAEAGSNVAEAVYTKGAAKYKALEEKADAASEVYGELGQNLISGPMQEDITGQAAVMSDAAGVINNNNAAKTSI